MPKAEMLESLSNINFFSGKFNIEPGKLAKILPELNDLVLVKVLDNKAGNFRILINGKVFQTELPLNIMAGDSFIAKVDKTNPFTLTANNLLASPQAAKSLPALLSMLGIKPGSPAAAFISKLAESKKPLIKSKIDGVVEFLNNHLDDPDELQLALMVQLYISNLEAFNYILKEKRELIKKSIPEIIKKIFYFTHTLLRSDIEPELREELHKALVIPNESGKEKKGKVLDRDGNLLILVRFLDNYHTEEDEENAVNENVTILATWLIEFLINKSLYNRFGLYPDFCIKKTPGTLSLIHFNTYKTTDAHRQTALSLGTKFDSNQLSKVALKGLLYNQRLMAEIFIEKIIPAKVNRMLRKIKDELRDDLDIEPYVTVKEKQKDSIIKTDTLDMSNSTF